MIYVTGDIHGDATRFSSDAFPEQKEMTKNDYVIIAGDFGLIWNQENNTDYEDYWLDWLDKKSFTTLFVDGNHENHERLAAFPVEEWNGGKVHKIRPSVIHLMRGQVYDIDDVSFFTFGGASSHDIKDGILEPDDPRIKQWQRDWTKLFRINRRSWWKEELPSNYEMGEGLTNLAAHDNKVDFVLSHCAPASIVALIGKGLYDQDILTNYLQKIKETIEYKKWIFGHYHINKMINNEDICLYEQIIRIV